jgi:serine/threonine protein kinase
LHWIPRKVVDVLCIVLDRSCNIASCYGRCLTIDPHVLAGLEYLHKSCTKRLIHRDVKTSNILLNDNLEAKIADFGLLKAFHRDDDTHVSRTRVVGTLGYFAPEYTCLLHLFPLMSCFLPCSRVICFGIMLRKDKKKRI